MEPVIISIVIIQTGNARRRHGRIFQKHGVGLLFTHRYARSLENIGEYYSYPRDAKIAANALKRANYLCAVNKNHPSFIRRSNNQNYTEPHHLIPLAFQDKFTYSLDVEANIISLCSNCHNEIHYGKHPEIIIKKLYQERVDELRAAGIFITLENLLQCYK